jgi:acyl-CoA dehydrogenase
MTTRDENPFRVLDAPLPARRSFFTQDPVLQALLARQLPAATWAWARPQLAHMGAEAAGWVGENARIADRDSPRLVTHDRFGNRIDRVDYHPAYREMEKLAYGSGMVGMKYEPELRALHGGHLQTVGFALAYLFTQGECGLVCPACMTDGVARVVDRWGTAEQKSQVIPRLAARDTARLWRGAMFLTEKQGGSDVGATATRAAQEGDGPWRIWGEKWFCSNVDAEAILTLARPEGAPEGTRGLGLFLVLRDLPDGRRNGLRIERLKEKLGVRSMPTGEVVLEGALAEPVGALDSGFKHMAEMLNLSRLYNAVCSVGLMRRAIHEATEYLRARRTFGRPAIEHALVRESLADLASEEVAAKYVVFRLAHHLGRADERGEAGDRALVRMLTPLAKYATAKLAVWSASEGIELCGGNGYIEESVMPRLLRDAQVLPVWEGTTNILVLDALRACAKEGVHEALLAETARLAEAAPAPVGSVAQACGALAAEARAALAWLAGAGEPGLGRAKRTTDRMFLAYELALLCEAAGSPDATEAAIAAAAGRRLVRRHVDPDGETLPDDVAALVDATVATAA